MINSSEQMIYVCSDSVGETAEAVVQATIKQFNAGQVMIKRIAHIKDEDEIIYIMEEASNHRAFIVYTLVQPELREMMKAEAIRFGIQTVDIMGPMMEAYMETFNDSPKSQPGLLHKLDDHYFRRVDALEFAVNCDDGNDVRSLLEADIVLIGVSRTSKTPLSMFLAYKGLKVANFPLIPEVRLPKEIFQVPKRRIIGLTIAEKQLLTIRMERLKSLGLADTANYTSMDRIMAELNYSNEIFHQLGCRTINVSNKAIEEIAGQIIGENKWNRLKV